MDLVILFRTILKKIWLLIIIPLIAGLIAYLLTINLKKQYLSRAQLATGFTVKDVADQDFNIMTADVKFDNLIEIILSPQVVSQTGYQLLIHDLTSDQPYHEDAIADLKIDSLVKKIGKQRIVSLLQSKISNQTILSSNNLIDRKVFEILEGYEYDFESIKDVLYIERAGRSDYVNIFAKTTNADLSAFIANSLSANFLKFNNSIRENRNMGSLDTLKQQVEEKRLILNDKQKQLTDFKTMIGILDLNTSGTSKLELVSSFEQTLADERRSLVESTSELQEINGRLLNLGSRKENSSSQLLVIRRQINTLEQSYERSKDPSVLTELKELRKKRDELAASYDIEGFKGDKIKKEDLEERASILRAKINSNRQNISSLEKKINVLNSNVSSYAGKEAELKALEQEVALAQSDYTTVNTRYNNAASLNSSFTTSGVTQSLLAQPAIKAESSKRLIIIIAAVAATFLIYLIGIILLEYFDLSVKTPANFTRLTQINVIGSVPVLNVESRKKRSDKSLFGKEFNLKKDAEKIELHNLLNKVRYELESSGCKLLLFTSTGNQVGKTTILSLITGIYAKSNKRVLIIDSNFSNNEITQAVETKAAENYDKLLSENKAADTNGTVSDIEKSEIRDLVYIQNNKIDQTTYSNIDVLGCKQNYYLQSEQFPENDPLNKLNNLKENYDYIFIEGPCLNTYTDSKELSKYVDGVVLVSSVKSQIKYIDKESLKFLKGLGPKFLGAILNGVDKRDIT
jgi:succinoglycan biosynthesis transport protein ExoP